MTEPKKNRLSQLFEKYHQKYGSVLPHPGRPDPVPAPHARGPDDRPTAFPPLDPAPQHAPHDEAPPDPWSLDRQLSLSSQQRPRRRADAEKEPIYPLSAPDRWELAQPVPRVRSAAHRFRPDLEARVSRKLRGRRPTILDPYTDTKNEINWEVWNYDGHRLPRDELERLSMSVILCTAGYDHTIRFWEALSGICSRTIQHPESQVNRLCISPDKRLLAAAGHEDVKLYDVRSTNPAPTLTLKGHRGNVTGVVFQCEGKWMATSSEDGSVKIWDTKTGTVQRNYLSGAPVCDVAIHPNQGELISGDRAGNVRVWDLGENKCTHQLVPEDDVCVGSVTVAADGSLLCAGNNMGNVYVWRIFQAQDTTTLVPVTSFQAHAGYITRVLLSPDSRHLATCSADHNARIWAVTARPATAASAASAAAAATTTTNSANSQDPDDPDAAARFLRPPSSAGSGSSTAAGTAPGPDSRPPTRTGGAAKTANPAAAAAAAAAAATAAQNGGTPFLPPLPLPPELARAERPPGAFPLEANLGAHQRWVWDCAFSADSAYLVTASSDHYARLWELGAQTVIRQYNGHHRGAVCVALNDFSENAR